MLVLARKVGQPLVIDGNQANDMVECPALTIECSDEDGCIDGRAVLSNETLVHFVMADFPCCTF